MADGPAALPPPALLARLFPAQHAALTPWLIAYAPFGCALALGRMALWAACFALDNPALVDADAPLEFMISRCLGVRLFSHKSVAALVFRARYGRLIPRFRR